MYRKCIKFRGIKFHDFLTIKIILFLFTHEKFQNHKIAKLNTSKVKYLPSLRFPFLIFDQNLNLL